MSSVISALSQIPAGSKYLFGVLSSGRGGFTQAALNTAMATNPSLVISYDGTILNVTNLTAFLGTSGATSYLYNNATPIAVADTYRDMGKQLRILENGKLEVIFRYGQLVRDNGAGNEGVGPSPNIYICTWQGYGPNCPSGLAMVRVVRTG